MQVDRSTGWLVWLTCGKVDGLTGPLIGSIGGKVDGPTGCQLEMLEGRWVVVVVVLGFYVPPTAKVIQRWNLGLKSHLKDWRSP